MSHLTNGMRAFVFLVKQNILVFMKTLMMLAEQGLLLSKIMVFIKIMDRIAISDFYRTR